MTKPLRERLIENGTITPSEIVWGWRERPFMLREHVQKLRDRLIASGILSPRKLRLH